MNRVVHFEIHAADPERAAKFYREVFGWEIAEWIIPGVKLPEENRYWTVTTGPDDQPGINGGIVIRRGPPPTEGQAVSGHICTIEVASVDLSLERVQQAGATIAVPKMPIPGVGWLAYCRDTEGNVFGVMQNDAGAERG